VETWFLLGGFEFLVRFVVVNRGEVVVDFVVNVVRKWTLFDGQNVGHLSERFFEVFLARGPEGVFTVSLRILELTFVAGWGLFSSSIDGEMHVLVRPGNGQAARYVGRTR
jgi:hypothetical protein